MIITYCEKGCDESMAIAIMILSTEKNRKTCTYIAASLAESMDALEVLTEGAETRKFLGVHTPEAAEYLSRAWKVMGEHWEALPPAYIQGGEMYGEAETANHRGSTGNRQEGRKSKREVQAKDKGPANGAESVDGGQSKRD